MHRRADAIDAPPLTQGDKPACSTKSAPTEEEGIELQKRYLGQLVGYFVSEIGPLNQIVHIWAYPSLDERERRRAALAEDPAWRAFAPKIQALMEEMENKIMKPARFSPLA
jgi:hypothetical protein